MEKKLVSTLQLYRCLGLTCRDCPLKGQGMNQKQFCSFYKKSHDSERPAFCKVEMIEITEGLELPAPREYDRDFNPIQAPEISTVEIHELCDDLHNRYGMNRDAHTEIEELIADWLEDKKIKIKR